MENVRYVKSFYILMLIIWLGLGFLCADQMTCVTYQTCDSGDFVSFTIIHISLLAPAFAISWVVIFFIDYYINNKD